MSRARRRLARATRLSTLTRDQRWSLIYGKRESSSFDSSEAWDEAFAASQDALLAELPDPSWTRARQSTKRDAMTRGSMIVAAWTAPSHWRTRPAHAKGDVA